MENLNKHQIILLALLVSFVTSIATGIVTVSLMDQAPVGVTQTINRVVERTIEKVVTPIGEKEIIKETVVLNSDDQVVLAVEKNAKKIVRIYKTTETGAVGGFVTIGIVVDEGVIAADNAVILDGNQYVASFDGTTRPLAILSAKVTEPIAFLKVSDGKTLGLSKVTFSSADAKLGQAVVVIGGEMKNTVANGIIASINTKDVKTEIASSTASTTSSKTETITSSLQTNIATSNLVGGAALVSLSGDLLGIRSTLTESGRTDLFIPAHMIKTALTQALASQKPE